MASKRRIHPLFVLVTLAWLLVATYAYYLRSGNGQQFVRSSSSRDAAAIAAAAERAAQKKPCEWCEVLKAMSRRDQSLEQGEERLSRSASDKWRERLERGLPRLAIIVPYRDRPENLAAFLKYMNPFLNQQCAGSFTYWIFVVEQSKSGRFNRGKLCNAGFNLTTEHFDYFIFHDIDKLPEKAENSYAFPNASQFNEGRRCGAYHLASRIQQFNYRWMEDNFVGGVIMFKREQFLKIGGFPNFYWGWGAEDDELRARLVKRSPDSPDACRHKDEEHVQRYSTLGHDRDNQGRGGAIPNLEEKDRSRFNCHYEMMKDYREGRRDTDSLADGAFRTLGVRDDLSNRASTLTVDLCWGNFVSRCTNSPEDAGCNSNRRFG